MVSNAMNADGDIVIRQERPDGADAMRLVAELDACLSALYPAESQHGYSVEQLLARQVHFFIAYCGGAPAGCGGAQLMAGDNESDGEPWAELKRMYVREPFRRRGLGLRLLQHLEQHIAAQGIGIIRLEAGIHQPAAIGLYEKHGYRKTGPFGEYRDDPLSLFYAKRLPPDTANP